MFLRERLGFPVQSIGGNNDVLGLSQSSRGNTLRNVAHPNDAVLQARIHDGWRSRPLGPLSPSGVGAQLQDIRRLPAGPNGLLADNPSNVPVNDASETEDGHFGFGF